MQIVKQSDEVFYAAGDLVTLGLVDYEFLKEQARRNPRKIARLCTHRDVSDRLHEMTIVNLRDTYIRPHKNTAKPKSFLVLEGAMDVVVFDDAGGVVGATRLSAPGASARHYFRLHETRFHTLRTVTDCVVFQETTSGPFQPGDTVFAPWAPEARDLAAGAEFMAWMDAAALRFLP